MTATLIGWRELAPDVRHFEFEVADVGGGRMSPLLFSLRPGDRIEFKGAYGGFVIRQPASRAILVATGTGIAPFRSQLLAGFGGSSLEANPAWDVTLIFGVRYREGLLYDADFRALAVNHPNFHYCPTLTRPPEDWRGLTGRVQSHVLAEIGSSRDRDVYICGLREMVDDLRIQLKAAGLDRKRIVYEKYD